MFSVVAFAWVGSVGVVGFGCFVDWFGIALLFYCWIGWWYFTWLFGVGYSTGLLCLIWMVVFLDGVGLDL